MISDSFLAVVQILLAQYSDTIRAREMKGQKQSRSLQPLLIKSMQLAIDSMISLWETMWLTNLTCVYKRVGYPVPLGGHEKLPSR